MQCLFQHVLTRLHCVGRLVRKTHPHRPRRERHGLLRRIFLVVEVRLHVVVQLQHQVVVFAAQRLGHMQLVQHLGLPA